MFNITNSMLTFRPLVAASDSTTLESWGLKDGSKVILMGTKSADLITVPVPPPSSNHEEEVVAASAKEPFCKQKVWILWKLS